MTFANITTSMVNKAIYTFGDMKKDGPYLENVVKREVTANDNTTTIKYSRIPQDKVELEGCAELQVIKNTSPEDTSIKLNLKYCGSLRSIVLTYELKENNKNNLDYINAAVWEYAIPFGQVACRLKNEKTIFLPLIQKVLDRETNTDYKRYLQAIYDGVKLA